jgi:hypothetical protein
MVAELWRGRERTGECGQRKIEGGRSELRGVSGRG